MMVVCRGDHKNSFIFHIVNTRLNCHVSRGVPVIAVFVGIFIQIIQKYNTGCVLSSRLERFIDLLYDVIFSGIQTSWAVRLPQLHRSAGSIITCFSSFLARFSCPIIASKRQLPAFPNPFTELSSGSKQLITGGVDHRFAGILYGADDKADRHNLHGNIIVDICVCIIKSCLHYNVDGTRSQPFCIPFAKEIL